MWSNGIWGAGDWAATTLMMLLFWGPLVALLVWLIRSCGIGGGRTIVARTEPACADQILAERFARGEIDETQFTQGRDALRSGRSL